jgi:hypothetical protein
MSIGEESDGRRCDGKRSMLVEVRELMDKPEGMTFRVVPSVGTAAIP